MKTSSDLLRCRNLNGERLRSRWWPLLVLLAAFLFTPAHSFAAPFAKYIHFTQPDQQELTLWGEGDEFHAVFETTTGYTVTFDPLKKAYFYAECSADGKTLVSTGVLAHEPAPQSLNRHVRIDGKAAAAAARERRKKWNEETGLSRRWSRLKAQNSAGPTGDSAGTTSPSSAPPASPTTGTVVGLTLLIDFPDDPATIAKTEIESFLNSDSYSGFGNNGSVSRYFKDVSNSRLNYTNVVTAYVRMSNPKSYYNDTGADDGAEGRLLINDALAILKSRSDYSSTILPTFSTLSTDASGRVTAFNVFFAGESSNVWARGLWPHSWILSAPVPLGNGKSVYAYQVTNVGSNLEIGTFCHESGHMVCGFPDLYDYDSQESGKASIGGAGAFSLMGYGGDGGNPAQVDAYLKTVAGWASVIDVGASTVLKGTLAAAPAAGYNTFYRYPRPGVPTEYFLFENRQQTGRDAGLPAAGIAVWHVDELGNRDNQNITPNPDHLNYELTLVQADDLFHFENGLNYGDPSDLYYLGNAAAPYTNRLDDASSPNSRWWDGSTSGLKATGFGASAMSMPLVFNEPPSYSVCGTVRSGSLTGPALEGVAVSLADKTALTDGAGSFCLTGITAGSYTLTLAKEGYLGKSSGLVVSEDNNGVQLYLTPAPTYTISGTVRQGSAIGPLLAGANVSMGDRSALTGSDGTFSLVGVRGGSYTVTVSKEGYTPKTAGYVVTGNANGLTYFLTLPTYTISGTVRQGSATGPALAGASVSIAGKSALTGSTGSFSIVGVSAGSYTLTVAKAGYLTVTSAGYQVSGNQGSVELYLLPSYTLSGTVRQGSATGPVLAGATVAVAGKSATTGSYGTFSVTGIPPGSYPLSISKDHFLPLANAAYPVGGNQSGLNFYLAPAPTYVISGTVRTGSATGPVVAGAKVAIAGKSALTTALGSFSIAGVYAGSYTLTISKTGYLTMSTPGYQVSGSQGSLEFNLTPTYSMSGTVRAGATGPVLSGATVTIAGKSAVSTSYGTFSIAGIPAGSYTLTVSRTGYLTQTSTDFIVGGNQSNVSFYLSPVPTYTVSGTVRQATGAVLSGATVSLGGKSSVTGSAGSFNIAGVPAGSYTLTVTRAGYHALTVTGYVISGDTGGVDLALDPLTYTLSGTVRLGSAIGPALSGASVEIAGKSAVTGASGSFTIAGVPTGSYIVTIARDGYLTKQTSYAVSGNAASLTFYLVPRTYTLSGTVRQDSASGAVLAGATVAVAGRSALTGSTGTFSIASLPAGSYTVTVSKAGYTTSTSTGYLISSDTSGAEFYLSPRTYTLSGTVRQGSATGPVLSGASVVVGDKSASTDSTGAFSLGGITAGSYTVTISKSGYLTKTASYLVSGNATSLLFYLTVPSYSVSGTVRQGSATGPVLPGASVTLAGKTVLSGSTGTFVIAGVPSGSYTLTVSKLGYITKTITDYVIDSNLSAVTLFLAANQPPTAEAGPDRSVPVGSSVTLDGTSSADPDGDPLSYSWSFVSKPVGSVAVLSAISGSRPSFVADKAGSYQLRLTVTDGKLASATDTITITASAQATNDYRISATSINDAQYESSSVDSPSYNGASTTTSGHVSAFSWWNGLAGTLMHGVSSMSGTIQLDLSQIPAGESVSSARLHVYVNGVYQVNNWDRELASFHHLRSTAFTGNMVYDYTHVPAPQKEFIYTFPSGSATGWRTFDVTSLIQADVAAGVEWAAFWIGAAAWENPNTSIDRRKGISLLSADYQGGAYAPFLEVSTVAAPRNLTGP
jgi:M6 family metalloprotease-like protein